MSPIRRLVVHVGLPKTGTTTLQKSVFSKTANYFGPASTQWSSSDLSRLGGLRRIIERLDPNAWDSDDTWDIRGFLHDVGHRMGDQNATALVSFENLIASHFYFGAAVPSHPLRPARFRASEHVRRILDLLAPDREHTSIIVTTRRQWTWLPALYAQRSDRIAQASQRDFERQVTKELTSPEVQYSTLNLSHVATSLAEDLHPESLTLLPLEVMGTEDYIEALKQAMGRELMGYPDVSLGRENSRQAERGGWALRPYGSGVLSAHLLREAPLRERTYGAVRNTLRPNGTICLMPAIEEAIRSRCAPWNALVPTTFTPLGLPGYF